MIVEANGLQVSTAGDLQRALAGPSELLLVYQIRHNIVYYNFECYNVVYNEIYDSIIYLITIESNSVH